MKGLRAEPATERTGGAVAEEFRALFSENWSLVVAVAEQRLGSRADGEEIAAANW